MKQKGKLKCGGKKAGKNDIQKQPSKKKTQLLQTTLCWDKRQGDGAFLGALGFLRSKLDLKD